MTEFIQTLQKTLNGHVVPFLFVLHTSTSNTTGLFKGQFTLSLKKRSTFTTCYNFCIHSSIATIFGTNVAEKVGNYFPTSPN